MESEIILEYLKKKLMAKNCIVTQIASDGASTMLSLLQKALLHEVAF